MVGVGAGVERFEAGDVSVAEEDLANRCRVVQFDPGNGAGVLGFGAQFQAGDAFR